MLNSYSKSKYFLLFLLFSIGVIYSLPNFYGEDYAISVNYTGMREGDNKARLQSKLEKILKEKDLTYKSINSKSENSALIRFEDSNIQIAAKEALRNELNRSYVVALSLAPAMPSFLEKIYASPVNLGLDLRGGVHFLMEVDVTGVTSQYVDSVLNELRGRLREQKVRYLTLTEGENYTIDLSFDSENARDKAFDLFASTEVSRSWEFTKDKFINIEKESTVYTIKAILYPSKINEIRSRTIEQTILTLRNRVNELGVSEALVQRHGQSRIVIELPGVQDTARAKEILGKTATLEFRLVDDQHEVNVNTLKRPPVGSKVYYDRNGIPSLLKKRIVLTGEAITGALAESDMDGRPSVKLNITGPAVNLFKKVTKDNINKLLAVVYVEKKSSLPDESGRITHYSEETIISKAVIRSQLGNTFSITGLKRAESQSLALLLRSGAMPAQVSVVEERTIGPSLGAENIELGLLSMEIGIAAVFLAMVLYYSLFGVIANLALCVNVAFLLALLSMIGATLTLPGIAGIVLTVGMAVDANILIFERIREEMRQGVSPQMSIHRGFDRAFSTIVDSNLTTLIAGIVLFSIGSGPVKGFAVTLSLGIVTSVFTSVVYSRALVNMCYGGKRNLKSLPLGIELFKQNSKFNFMGKFTTKVTALLSVCLVVTSLSLVFVKGINFGLDFTGGTLIEARFEDNLDTETIRKKIDSHPTFIDAKVSSFSTSSDILVKFPNKGNLSNELIKQHLAELFGKSINILRIEFVGAEVGDELAEQGFLAMLVAMLAILIYIAFRFEYRFAVSSVIALIHDPIIILGLFAALQLEFDMSSLAAILAVIGYSLNDTIVVFDRVRENFKTMRNSTTREIMNASINQTLSRTIMTSALTALVLIALYIYGGDSLHSFSSALLVGVMVGTYSSIFIAGTIAIYLGLNKEDLLAKTKKMPKEVV